MGLQKSRTDELSDNTLLKNVCNQRKPWNNLCIQDIPKESLSDILEINFTKVQINILLTEISVDISVNKILI